MRVGVDKAGSDEFTGRVDNLIGFDFSAFRPADYIGDPVTLDQHIADVGRFPASVDDRSVFYQRHRFLPRP
jgi:hypothetical protein